MTVGPESAGAAPGPVCYGGGGTEPTITDANLILGYLNPGYLVGGELRLDAALARSVFEDQVARPLGLSLEHAAYGAHLIAAANMIRAIRAVSIERGRDPRDYALCAFGGNGPVFACAMAKELGMRRIVVPPAPGLFSAFGLLYADVEHHYGRTFRRLLRQIDLAALNAAWDELVAEAARAARGRGLLARRGCASSATPACTTRARASISPCRCRTARSTTPRSPASRRRSGRSTSAPTAIAPAPRSRSS